MKEFSCPSCGAKIVFKTLNSVSAVCGYCDSLVIRHDLDLESLGKIATLREDLSPLQLGTRGKIEKRTFTLLGRTRQSWEDGYWNEWYLSFDDGKFGWLGEAQGLYALSEEIDDEVPNQVRSLQVGDQIEVKGSRFTVQDLREVAITAAEGELPFRPAIGDLTLSIDAIGEDGRFVGFSVDIKKTDSSSKQVFLGRYLEFTDFEWSQLRELPGWEGLQKGRLETS